jgi:hypothetical protein
MSIRKELKILIDEAYKQGWEVTITNSNHLRWRTPSGGIVFTSYSPSDTRALYRIRKDLKLNGFIELKRRGKHVKNKEID